MEVCLWALCGCEGVGMWGRLGFEPSAPSHSPAFLLRNPQRSFTPSYSPSPGACGADPDGLTLYFFNDQVSKFETVKREEDVDSIFQRYYPSGFTDLTAALEAAFAEHFGKHKKRPTTMLVIHDGEPNNPESTKQSLRNAANRMQSKKELAVSFVQVGDDPQATAFLETLDVGLGTKWDIVDKMHARDLQGQSFSDAVKQSIG